MFLGREKICQHLTGMEQIRQGIDDRYVGICGKFLNILVRKGTDHVSPEAAAGGAIALIEDGDEIEIDLPNRALNLLVDEDVLEARRKKLQSFTPKIKTGWLARYSALVTSANTGGVMKSFDEIMRDMK